AETHEHARRIRLDRDVDELTQLGEGDDLLKARLELVPAEAMQRALKVDVLPAGKIATESRRQLEQRDHPATAARLPGFERDDPGQHAEGRGLAGAVAAHDPHRLARTDSQADPL